jgi:hypothetical protein
MLCSSSADSIKVVQVNVHRLPPPSVLLGTFVEDPKQGFRCAMPFACAPAERTAARDLLNRVV